MDFQQPDYMEECPLSQHFWDSKLFLEFLTLPLTYNNPQKL